MEKSFTYLSLNLLAGSALFAIAMASSPVHAQGQEVLTALGLVRSKAL